MPGKFHHETLYRGAEAAGRLAELRVTICGAGAVGSHLADGLCRQGLRHLRVIDFDRIEEHNVSTQLYGENEVGLFKVETLRNRLFRSVGVEIDAVRKQLIGDNAHSLLSNCELVIDAFDNSAGRAIVQRHCRAANLACLHVGLAADYGEVIWDERYRVPGDVGSDTCDYAMARNLVLLVCAVAAETVVEFAASGDRRDWSITLRDLAIRQIPR